jgi:hypothetical protein
MIRRALTSTYLGAFGGLSALIAVLAAVGALHSPTPAASTALHSFCPGIPHQVFGGKPGLPDPKPGYAAHFVFGSRRVVAGQSPGIKLVNEGTDALDGQNGYVQRWRGNSWRKLPNPHAGSAEPLIGFLMTPGLMSACLGPRTGPHWPLGKYRWVQWYEAHSRSGPDGRHRLRAVFWIMAREEVDG